MIALGHTDVRFYLAKIETVFLLACSHRQPCRGDPSIKDLLVASRIGGHPLSDNQEKNRPSVV